MQAVGKSHFLGSGLWPFDRSAISVEKFVKEVEELADEYTLAITPSPVTPQLSTAGSSRSNSPPPLQPSQSNKKAAEIAKKKHK